jgi:hypothetical protein
MNTNKIVFAVVLTLFASFVIGGFSSPLLAARELVIADFDTGDKPNNLGGDFGSWDKDPNDETQSAAIKFASEDALGDPIGYAAQVNYDVDSPNPAYNGFWMKLNELDATPYSSLTFYLKGDANLGFTNRIKIELKDGAQRTSPFILSGVSNEWQKFSIPLEKFRQISDWSALTEFVLVFDDINSSPKVGGIFLDQLTLEA